MATTEFIAEGFSQAGPTLPTPLVRPCILTLDIETNKIMIIGGSTTSGASLSTTYIYDLSDLNNITYMRGPNLTEPTQYGGCGTLRSTDTEELMVVSVDGSKHDKTMEYWIVDSPGNFILAGLKS